jgi:murein peptide amidase A
VSGDYDGDGKSDVVMLYDYGKATSRLWIFKSDGTTMTPSMAWYGGPNNIDASRTKLVSGDYDGDGKSDVAMLYDYGKATSRLWIFKSDGTTLTPSMAWRSQTGGFDWTRTKLVDANSGFNQFEAKDIQIGVSVKGRPIIATKIGSGNRRYLFVGMHHGNEPQGGRLLALFRDYLIANPGAVPNDAEVWIVPYLNPDGLAADTRWNARGVDLNRNYATANWGIYDVSGHPFETSYPGIGPFSEPETAAIATLCSNTPFRAMINFHESLGCVYWGGPGQGLAALYGGQVGLPLTVDASPISGTATQWFSDSTGNSAVTVELTSWQAAASPAAVFNAYLPALLGTLYY